MSPEIFQFPAQCSKIPEFPRLHGPDNLSHSPETPPRFLGTNYSMTSLPTITTQGCPHEHNIHPISSQVTSIGRMGMIGQHFDAYGPLSPVHIHQRSTSLVIPTNSIRRKRNNDHLKETFRLPFMFVESTDSIRDIPDRPATPEPQRARSFRLKRTESVVFSAAKGESWSSVQERLSPWAAKSPTTPETPEMRRPTSTASMDPLEFIKWTDERKEGTKRVRAKQIAEMRAAGIVFEDPALCDDEEILSPSKRVRLSIENQAKSSDVDVGDELMEDDDDDNIDDYNLELQCSSSDSDDDLLDPSSYQWAKGTDADGAEEFHGTVGYEGDDEEGELMEEEEEEENGCREQGLNVAAGPNVLEASESLNADLKAVDDGCNAFAALTLTDPLTLDPRSINNNVFSAANDQWLLETVPLFQEKHKGMEAWVEIQKAYFMASHSVLTIPCLQGRYVLLQNGSPLIQRSRV